MSLFSSSVAVPDPGIAHRKVVPCLGVDLDLATVGPTLTVVIEKRALLRECLVRGLANSRLEGEIAAFESVEDWLARRPTLEGSPVVLLSTEDRSTAEIKADCQKIGALTDHAVPIALLAENEKADYIVEALNDGVRGFIPTNVPLGVAVEAIQLVRAGGVFVPPQCLMQIGRNGSPIGSSATAAARPLFSGRQAAVVSALRKGMANKIIAHELQMAEGTVKVHVRNIMRKLKARNRTHAAFLLAQMDEARW